MRDRQIMNGIAAALCILAFQGAPVALASHTVDKAQSTEQHGRTDVLPIISTGDRELSQVLAPHARSAVLMDFVTGRVWFEKDAHEEYPMASITKIMTLLLIMEALDSGRLHLEDSVTISEHAASMGGSQIFLQPNETMKVNDLLKGIAMASANDACVAMAEHLYGSEEAFVAKMNQRAKQLGMDDTHFVNTNGLPAEDHYSSAHDIAIMSRALLRHGAITQYTSVYSDYLRKDTDHPFWLVNTNKLVRFYQGLDGLKTGYTNEAKYCLSATAKRKNFRVIAVVMGEPSPTVRNQEVSQMLNWTFSQYTSKVLYQQGQKVTQVKVDKGMPDNLSVVAGDMVGIVHEVNTKPNVTQDVDLDELHLPVKSGEQVGTLKVYEHGNLVAKAPLLAGHYIGKASLLQTIKRTFRKVIHFG